MINLRFYYFHIHWNNLNDGVGKKVFNQCINLTKAGVDVHLLLISGKAIGSLNQEFAKFIKIFNLNSSTGSNVFVMIKRQYELRKIFVDVIKSASSSDILYIRYPYPLFYLLWPFSRMPRRCKIVNEHNTVEHKEFKLTASYLSLFIDFIIGNLMRNKADGIVGVTDEITSYEVRRSGDLKKLSITIGNGIEVNKIKLRKPPGFIDQELQLLCVASFNRWHGIDRLLNGLALYDGDKIIRLYIVGDGQEITNLKLIANNLKINGDVIFTGFMDGIVLDDLFDKSHLAIGSLGLHRMDMKEGSILKAREYCARGIPFLYGCSDPDFGDDFPYIKKVPGDESPIDIDDIFLFAEKVYSDPEHHIKMRAYAEKNLDWSIKMKRLKEFCEKLVDR